MRNLVKKTLLISSLLISTNYAHNLDEDNFTNLCSALSPKAGHKPVFLEVAFSPSESTKTDTTSRAELYTTTSKEQLERRAKLIQRIAGKNAVSTLANVNAITDGSYLFLTQHELVANQEKILAALEDAMNIHLILEAEADESGVFKLDGDLISTANLHLIDSAQSVKVIGQSFLATNKTVQHITFSGFKAAHTVESGFMLGTKVKSVDLSSLENLTTIKDCFLAEATSLTHLTLPTTRFFNAKLKTVGNHFLRGASALTQIQEEAFESVTTMGSYFMSESAILSFNTAKLKDLLVLDAGFLAKCPQLIEVNVAGLKRITPALVTKADVAEAVLKTKGGKIKARHLQTALDNGQRHNLGVFYGCDTLGSKLNGIRGVEHLPRALRVELADRFGRPNWIDIEADCCGL